MPDDKRNSWLARLFWIAACGNVLLVLIPALEEWSHPRGQFSGLVVFGLLAIVLLLAVVIAIVAAFRTPVAYGIGLALVCVPLWWAAWATLGELGRGWSAPSLSERDTGRGYFSAPADRALAEAIVAGDVAKVASLAPAANLGAQGWEGMTFMRLALEDGQANQDILRILLRAGIDPDQSSSLLYRSIRERHDAALLRVVIDAGVDLGKHMGRGQWFLFVGDDWPEGLALVLDHGADTEARDAMGYTAIMRAARAQSWPTVEALLAHGARTDSVGNDGLRLRDLLSQAIASPRGEIPPRMTALLASLR
ncbi:MAG: hypothetical protein U1E21_00140 [Reyranellaceae bacterium]